MPPPVLEESVPDVVSVKADLPDVVSVKADPWIRTNESKRKRASPRAKSQSLQAPLVNFSNCGGGKPKANIKVGSIRRCKTTFEIGGALCVVCGSFVYRVVALYSVWWFCIM